MIEFIDPISSAIGRLQGEMEAAHRQGDELTAQVTNLRQDLNEGFRDVRDLLTPLAGVPAKIERQEARLTRLEARGHRATGVAVALSAVGTGALGVLGWLGSKLPWSRFLGGS